MYSKLLFASMLMLAALTGNAQFLLTGKVVNVEDHQPIAFANIGIVNTSVGTCGYEDGSFRLIVPANMINDNITFSAIGFSKFELKIDTLHLDENLILLKEDVAMLREIQITPSDQVKSDVIGLTSPGVFNNWGEALASSDGGSAWATKIEMPETVIDIKKVNLHIFKNDLDSFNIRCRIMSIGQDNLPSKDLLNKSVILRSSIKKGWVSIDFSSYEISLAEDFFLVFEWIMDKKGAQLAAEFEANSLPWRLPDSDIWNNNLMVYLDENGEMVKQKLTKSQQKQCKEREFPQTWFGIKKTKTDETNYSRKGSMAPWIEQPAFDLVANIEYQWY
ncbi:carboxypeptidase-like regulatory domain-containing protein [Reichenbachiella sp.]|uniref:carboxypeptidase-like regulatory domain-containing protein n=1 Tax=Reichenbachiella sp. TaxID=2184521 RepID=UPI003BB1B445